MHNPNDGENQVYYSGNAEGGRKAKVIDKAGVADGLSSIGTCEVKNAGKVSANQRPLEDSMNYGSFKIGT